jgi:hypothetical protein
MSGQSTMTEVSRPKLPIHLSPEASVIRAATTQAGPENLPDPTIDADLFASGRAEVRARLTAARRARPQGHPS